MVSEFSIAALKILDPRGRPTLQVTATLGSGHTGVAGVPSGACEVATADGHTGGLGDEGGFAPQISETDAVLDLLVHAITDARYIPGRSGVAIALYPAANALHTDSGHRVAGQTLTVIAEFAVASGCGQLKSGAPARGERVVKDDPLLQIAAADPTLPFKTPGR